MTPKQNVNPFLTSSTVGKLKSTARSLKCVLAWHDCFGLWFNFLFPQGQIKHCQHQTCDGIFNVNSDIERYCWLCNNWYHIRCIKRGKLDSAPTVDQILGFICSLSDHKNLSLQKALLLVPIERGGRFGVCGNGSIQLPVRNALRNAAGLNPRTENIGSDYLQMASATSFVYFHCPDCDTPIWIGYNPATPHVIYSVHPIVMIYHHELCCFVSGLKLTRKNNVIQDKAMQPTQVLQFCL